jgi:REP element-mobilizing transposase RayT
MKMDDLEFGQQRLYRNALPHLENSGRSYFITVKATRMLSEIERSCLVEIIQQGAENQIFDLFVGVVMPDHVHVVIRPRPNEDGKHRSIDSIVRSWKSLFARKTGHKQVFQTEQYDRVIRHAEWADTTRYIRANPMVANLVERPEDYPWYFEGSFENPRA